MGQQIDFLRLEESAALAKIYAQIFPHKNITEALVKKIFRDEPAQILVSSTDKNTMVGFLYFWMLKEEWQIMDIGVLEGFRRQGVARGLLQHLLAMPRLATVATITLEVNSNNYKAIALYKSLGFVQTGVRPRYYLDSGDALLMDLFVRGN